MNMKMVKIKIICVAILHQTDYQEAMILDPNGVPIARDTEDIVYGKY